MRAFWSVALPLVAFLSGCGSESEVPVELPAPPASSAPYQGSIDFEGGTIAGLVRLLGPVPVLEPRKVDAKSKVCGPGTKQPNEILVSGDGFLENVVVTLEGIRSGKPMPAKPQAILDQRECDYQPHVQVVPIGATLDILNSDDLLHNVHGKLNGRATLFNLAMPLKGQRLTRALSKAGVLHLQCDAGHTWMKGYIVVVEHPYFEATSADGTFVLSDVPEGTFTLRAWHESLGVLEQPVEVRANQQSRVTFEY